MRHAATVTVVVSGFLLVGAAAATVPNDPDAAHPAYAALNLPAAWDLTTGSPEVVIAIVDSGVDPGHPELAGAVAEGYDFVIDRAGATPVDGHGTGVASVAASRANNGIGGVGACFECRVLPLQVVGADGIARNVDIAAAIDYAVDHGAAVVNISLIGPNSPPELARAIARARAASVLVVAAAGNDATDAPQFPAAVPGTISVGASTYDGRRASFSNHGSWVRFAAPECAPTAVLGGASGVGCGTSVSAPLVAGIVALMRTRAPYATPDDIEAYLARTARAVPGTSFGVPDAAAALTLLGQPRPRLRPVIFGEALAGREIEVFTGMWSRATPTATYQWERCREGFCSAIAGADTARYAVTGADVGLRLRAVVTAAGLGAAASPLTPLVSSAPKLLARPAIVGRARVGVRLVARHGRWQGTNLRYVVNWQRCRGACLQVATGHAYRPTARDRGARLRLEVVAHNALGAATAFSARTGVVG
jgi:hypothetical protein